MSERLTLVVFKDHLSSRTLTVRLAWLRAAGLALLIVIGLALISIALFFNAYRKTISSGSVATTLRVEELQRELEDSRSAYDSLKTQALGKITGGAALAGAAHSFSLLPPESILEPLPAVETLPFRLEAIKAEWKGQTLHIRSAIEYAKEDGGNQQGHFFIFARGPHSLMAYPDSAFSGAGSPNLLKPESGEFFSVSRYREIKAEFGPFQKRDDVTSIEILMFDQKGRLIYVSRMGLQPGRAIPSPKASEVAEAKEKPVVKKPAPKPVAPSPVATPQNEDSTPSLPADNSVELPVPVDTEGSEE